MVKKAQRVERANASLDDLRGYLSICAKMSGGKGHEALVRKHGRMFEGSELLDPETRGPKGECFRNALLYALQNELYYCEGYAISIVPMHHAWCLDADGNVVDTTWDEPERCVYAGLVMDPEQAMKIVQANGMYGLFYTKEFRPYLTGDLGKDITKLVSTRADIGEKV